MSLFAIGDTHLSLGTDKPMNIFRGWDNYVERLVSNWNRVVDPGDTVVIMGDVSWGMSLSEAYKDFELLNSLPGKKIIMKGNHDYWWNTKNKMDKFFAENGFDTINILHNNHYSYDGYGICGTRGWISDNGEPADQKVLAREAGRLALSIESAQKAGLEPVVFLHYPPLFGNSCNYDMLEVLHKYGIKKCFYGHLHGKKNMRFAIEGEYEGIDFKLISCDRLSFMPILVR